MRTVFFFFFTTVYLVCLISSEFRGCRGRSVLLTPALPRPPGHPQKSEGNEKERMEDPVWAQPLVEAPQWRPSSNSVECPTLWGPLLFFTILRWALFFTILRWAFFSEDAFFYTDGSQLDKQLFFRRSKTLKLYKLRTGSWENLLIKDRLVSHPRVITTH